MFPYLQKVFQSGGYVPLGQCYDWQTEVLAANMVGNILIALVYFSTPFFLYYLSRRRNLQVHNYLLVVISLFGLMGSLRYVLEVVSIWEPVYYLLGLFKIVTGLFAVATLFVLAKTLPQALGLDKADSLKLVNEELVEEVAERKRAQVALRQANEALESRVQQRTGQLIKINRELEKEIEQRKKTEQDLLEKNKELTRINAELDNFVFHASHDLKDPIVKIEGLVTALKEEIPQVTPSVNTIFQHLDGSLLQVDQTVLDLTEVGRFQKADDEVCEVINIEELFQEVQQEMSCQLTEANATIHTAFRAPQIKLAPQKLKRIFANLLSNAIYLRKPGEQLKITVETEAGPDNIMLRVSDNGKGLNHAETITSQDFAEKPVPENNEGLGLSFYVVKRIVTNCNGQITFQSKPGQGCTFQIVLPQPVYHQG